MLPFSYEFRVRFKRHGKWHNCYFESFQRALDSLLEHLYDGFSSDVQFVLSVSGCNQSE